MKCLLLQLLAALALPTDVNDEIIKVQKLKSIFKKI